MARILVLGMNPAWQTVMSLGHLHSGGVNRASDAVSLASGKGMNCARVLNRLGHDVTLVQVLAGENGQRCLRACEALGIRSLHVWAEAETRSCLTLLEQGEGSATEIIGPFAVDHRPEWTDSLLGQMVELGKWDAAVILGTLPNGWRGNFYAKALREINADIKVLDTLHGLHWTDLNETHWIKVNAMEWRDFQARNPDRVAKGASTWRALITQGPDKAWVENFGGKLGEVGLPTVASVNPIGAGDTVTAGLTHHLLMGRDMSSAVIAALSLGMASCLEMLPAHFDPQIAQGLLTDLHWTSFPEAGR